MNIRIGRHRRFILVLLAATLGSLAGTGRAEAQQAAGPPVELPKPEDIEPGVDTSAGSGAAHLPAAPPAAAPSGATSSAATSSAARSEGRGRSGERVTAAAAKQDAAPAAKAEDRLDLDTTQITGNRELPKVLYIVPWKRPDLGDLSGRPPNTLVEEILAPIDRDVFQRENRYYEALKPDGPHASNVAGRGSETGEPAAGTPRNGP
jgi:hypothetical protein